MQPYKKRSVLEFVYAYKNHVKSELSWIIKYNFQCHLSNILVSLTLGQGYQN